MFKRLIGLIVVCGVALVSIPASAQRVSVSTNVGDWAFFGTINGELDVAVSRHFSVNAGAKYNPWTFNKGNREKQVQHRQRSASVGARWWPWHVYSGWWVGARGQWQEFNRTAFSARNTKEGTGVGAAFSGGYSMMLTPHFNVEFGLGLWGGKHKYVEYACPTCGRIIGSGEKWFVLPNEIIASVVYVF